MEVYEFPALPAADEINAGLLRTAGEEDEKNCQCGDAAITPSNFYDLSNYRIANKAYAVDDVVAVPYHANLRLKCTVAGTTAVTALDTTSITIGQTITDGTVNWSVEEVGKVKSVNGIGPDANGNIPLSLLDFCHPIGSLYWSANATEPSELFGGTWERVKDKFILAAGDSYAAGDTGGEATHTLTTDEMPSHNHTRGTMNITGNFAVGGYGSTSGWYGGVTAASGAFSRSSVTEGCLQANDGYDNKGSHYAYFNAANNWSGSTSSVGGGEAHNNMPPYETYYCWKRTA